MKWLALIAALARCSSEHPPCTTCTEAGTCAGGEWNCGECPDGGADAPDGD